MSFPPPLCKTMGGWSLPVLVDLLKTRATAALVTDLCAFRWRVICLRRAECFTKLMNINTTQQLRETSQRNESGSWSRIRFDMGSCGLNQRGYSISSPVFSGEVGARARGSRGILLLSVYFASSPREFKTVLDSWFHAVYSGCQSAPLWNMDLDCNRQWDSAFLEL